MAEEKTGKIAPAADQDVSTKKKGAKADEKVPEELSEEDQELKSNLEMFIERVKEDDLGLQKTALEALRKEIVTSTSSMTSVPKPLKFLRPHYPALKDKFEIWNNSKNRQNIPLLADVISLLAMTLPHKGDEIPESLKFRLLGSCQDIGSWGHEYVRNLAGEIGFEYQRRQMAPGSEEAPVVEDLLKLAGEIVPFHMKNNAEPEAVDLLIEVERLSDLALHCDEGNYARTCMYLMSCALYLPEPEDSICLEVSHQIYMKVKKYPDAMRVALRMSSEEAINKTFSACEEKLEKRQLAYMLARHGVSVDIEAEGIMSMDVEEEEKELVAEILSNGKLSEQYLALARDLDVMEAKTPEDIYKTHLVEGRAPTGPLVDSARHNLATTFVNAFVNAGYGHDKLITTPAPEDEAAAAGGGDSQVSWIFKNKEHGKVSAAASLGAVLLWDVEGGLPQIDKYLYSTDHNVVAGALLAVGMVNCHVRNECDPAFALLYDSVTKDDVTVRIGAIQGMGLAYVGTAKKEVKELLVSVVTDDAAATPTEVLGFTALSLGLVFVGTGDSGCAGALCQALMTRSEEELQSPLGRMAFLGLGLLFLGLQAKVEATAEIVKVLSPKVSRYALLLLEACAYAGSGNVLKVQHFLSVCAEHPSGASSEGGESESEGGDKAQGVAVLGIALVALSEELGSGMSQRTMEHLLQYGEPAVRRAVPLALALLSTSNPELTVTDMLSRLSHDTDEEVAMAAVLSLGMVSAGTNNARVAAQLRQLSSYYYKEPNLLFLLRVAQGLAHLGKGLLSLNPYNSHRLLSPTALAGLLCTLFCALDMKATVLAKYHHVLFYLVASMQPRMLMTLDHEGKPLPVTVRVGQAVDVVGQAGRPKTITGFQTHTTPVLLAVGDRAELANDKYIPMTPILEGCVILKLNPDYVEPTVT